MVQCSRFGDVCVTGGHILYMSACSVEQQSHSQKDGLTVIIFCLCSPTGPQRAIRFGVLVGRSGQGWTTICGLAVQGWSGCIGHPVDLLLSSSRSTPLPLLPLTLSAPSTTVNTCDVKTSHFRVFFQIKRH